VAADAHASVLHRPGVLELFRSQYWVAAVPQLTALGLSRRAVDRARRQGLVVEIHRGIVGVAGLTTSFESRAMAAQLAMAPSGFLSGVTAGRLYGLRAMPASTIEVTVPEDRSLKPRAGVTVVRTSWDDDEATPPRPDGLVLASPLRTLFGLAGRFNQFRFERAAEDLWHRNLVTPASAAGYLARIRRRGLTGVARMEEWLEKTEAQQRPATTGLEQLLATMAERAGLPTPVRQYPLVLADGVTIHLDLAWPEIRFALEPGHSWWHGGDRRQDADQTRDRACAEVGWLVVRFDESVWDRQAEEVERLRRTYHRRRRDLHGFSVAIPDRTEA
jgi:hypothetical protein